MMKYFGTILLLVCVSTLASAQVFQDDFTGLTTGTKLAGQSSWTKGGTGPDDSVANANPLIYAGYPGGGAEYVVMPTASTTSSRVYKTFPSPVTNYSGSTFYFSVLLRLTSTSTTATGYFMSLGTSGTGTSYGAKLFAKTSGAGFNIGLSKTSNTAVFDTSVLNLNTTYLIVVRYTFNAAGTVAPQKSDDAAFLWVNPSFTTEPDTTAADCKVWSGTDVDFDGYGALTDVGNFVWHYRGTANPTGAFDAVKVGSGKKSAIAWASLLNAPLALFSSMNLNFGSMNVGTSLTDSLSLTNAGFASLNVTSITSSNPLFVVSKSSATLAPSDTIKVGVTYSPTSVATDTGTVAVVSNSTSSPDTILLAGSGVQAGFSGTPTSISFGNVFKDSTVTDTVTVTNASTSASLVIDSVRSSNSLFTVTPGNATITTSSSAKFAVAFTPTAKGAATANIIFYHNAPSHQDTVEVSGNGILFEPLFTATPSSIDFGAVLLTKSKMDSIVVKNTGYDSLIISSVATGDAAFVVTPSTARLDTMASQKFYVTFTAGAAGYKSGSIVFVNNTSETKDTVLLKANVLTTVPISEARKDLNNDYVADHSVTHDTLVISGVITSPNMGLSASQMSYFMQDATGGLDLWVYGLSTLEFARGDSVMVTGTVAQYKGVIEFTPLAWDNTNIKLLSHVAVPAPKHVTLHQFFTNPESYEGQLIEVDTVYKTKGTWPATPANVSLYVTDGIKLDTLQLFIDFDSNIGGTEPAYPINIVGIMSQYSSSVPPNNGYEISPRDSADIIHTPGTAGVDNQFSGVPKNFELFNSYPNPFNPSTTISYGLPQQSKVTLKVYSVLGQEIATLVDDVQGASYHKIQWNGRDNNGMQVSSGVYFFRIVAQPVDGKSQTFTQVRKMMLMK